MTVVDLYLSLPIFAKVMIAIIIAIILIESLLSPYVWYHRYKGILNELEDILRAFKANKKDFEDSQRMLTLLIGLMGKKMKHGNEKGEDHDD